MKKLILASILTILLSGCASERALQRAEGPTSLGSYFRQLHECIIIETYERAGREPKVRHKKGNRNWERDENPIVTVLEDVRTGERFEVFGNYGMPGSRIKIGL